MKKLFTFFTLALLSISLLFTGTENASAVTEEGLSKDLVNELKKKMHTIIKEEYPGATFTEISVEEYNELKERAENGLGNSILGGQYNLFGSAPPVTYLTIDAIISANGFEEVFNKYSTQPVKGYTGVATMEIGYGNRMHWLGDYYIRNYDPEFYYETELIDFNGDNIVDAFYHMVFFDSDEHIGWESSKVYKFQSTSRNYPWNTMSDWINIVHE